MSNVTLQVIPKYDVAETATTSQLSKQSVPYICLNVSAEGCFTDAADKM